MSPLEKLREEIKNLENQIIDPDVLKDTNKLKEISKDLAEKQKKLSFLEKIEAKKKELKEALEMAKYEEDMDLKKLALEEASKLKAEISKLKVKLKKKDTEDLNTISQCILEIRAGTGGEEASLFAFDLFRMYARFAESQDWKITIISKHETGTGGFKEITAQIDGKSCYSKLKYENGVHRVQRVPLTESLGRIHTSAASVVIYPLLQKPKIKIDSKDIRVDVYRSSGPGGQSVNTTDSAVRITHLPTGLVVTCQDEKSQHKNKQRAMSILLSRLEAENFENTREKIDKIRQDSIKTGDRSVKIRTYNFPQNRVTDHRINKSWYNLKEIVGGDIGKIINELDLSLNKNK